VSSDKNLCLTLSKWQHQDSTKLTPISESKQNEKTESPSAPQITSNLFLKFSQTTNNLISWIFFRTATDKA